VPPRDFQIRVQDILDAVEKIVRYVEGMSFQTFCEDRKTVDAVIRNITVIGEAARSVPDEITERYQGVPWRDMRDMRNVLIHEYFGVSLEILWQTIHDDLMPLKDMLEKLLADEE